jgi:hypothetical protein
MGRQSSITKPFERDELERLANATSHKGELRPTSKLTRDEILGLIAESARPPMEDRHPASAPAHEPPPPAESSSDEAVAEAPAASPLPVPVQAQSDDSLEVPLEPQSVEPSRVPVESQSVDEAVAQPAPGEAIRRPLAPRSALSLYVSVAIVVAAVIVTLLVAV